MKTLEINANAKTVIERRIAKKDNNGNPIETADEVFKRVANNISQAERNYQKEPKDAYDKFYRLLSSLDFLPNSPTLVNAGHEMQQLSACFVLPVEDSMEDIFESVKNAALIHKSGGGTGFSFTRLRPESSRVSKTSGIASGPVSFMQVFNEATEVIKQGGTRRGANMGILRVDHPDILKFISMKSDNVTLQNFNISVAITDKFMAALEAEDDSFDLVFNETVYETVNARVLWHGIISNAWLTGDPGIIFIDRINRGRGNPVQSRGPIEATNPCGEQPLYPYDSCNLGSINLANFVSDDGGVDYSRLSEVVQDSVHFLDNVIDMNKYPLTQIDEVSKAIRRIGLGVMGWADLLLKLRIPYASEDALILAEQVMAFIQDEADKKSIILGMVRGSFPDKEKSIYSTWPGLRHSTRTTIAPTGTISIIAGVSSGIEPIYSLAFVRSHYLDKDDPSKRHEMVEVNEELIRILAEAGSDEESISDAIKFLANGAPISILGLPEKLSRCLDTAHEITPDWHVRMQAAFQKHTDNAVSKTINLPNSATESDVDIAYRLAYSLDCNGVTVYRDGSKQLQVLSSVKEQKEEDEYGVGINGLVEEMVQSIDGGAENRPTKTTSIGSGGRVRLKDKRAAINHKFHVGDFEGYLSVGLYENGQPGELFIVGNKSGSTTRGYLDTIGTLISISLQRGTPIDEIAAKLIGTRYEPSGRTGNPDIPVSSSVGDYIGRWLRREFVDQRDVTEYTKAPTGDMCPECDSPLFYGEGCHTCMSCGYSKCG